MGTVTLEGNPIHTSGDLPAVGAPAPEFRLIDRELNERSLADFRGRPKILNIVPSLDTSVCAMQTRRFNQEAANLGDVHVLVVSADLPFAQARFCEAEGIAGVTPLSTVRSQDFGDAYGVTLTEGPLAGICARAVLVIDSDDIVRYAELVPEIGQEPDYDAALESIRSVQ